MREIKFRGMRSDNKGWVHGYYFVELVGIRKAHSILVNTETKNIFEARQIQYYIDSKTIGQFTGLHDKNGKEIYEGDILRYPASEEWKETNYISYEVFYHDNDCANKHVGFQMNRMHFHGCMAGGACLAWLLPKYTKTMVIIGNIYQNPELLEV